MMKNKNLLNLVERKSYEQTRKDRHSLDPILSRFCVVSLIYANKLLNHRTTPLGRFVLPEHLPFSKPKVNWLLHVSLICLCMLTVGVGNVWGAAATLPVDYTLNGNSYPTGCSGNSISLQGYAAGNNPYRLKFDGTGDYLQIQVDAAAQQIIFGVKKIGGADNSTFTVKGSSDGSSYTDIEAFSITGAQNAVVNCTTSVSINSSYRYFRFVFTKGANVGFGTLKISKASSCDKKVTITKGTPETGGAFSLDKTGEQNCCDALTVTVSSIVAPSGKKFSAITQSGIASGVTINQSAKTVTYAANTTGSSTINVTFEDKGCTDKGASSITGGALSDADHGPLHAYYDYSTSQILYTKSDLDLAAGKKGTIKSIYFEYSGAAAMAARTIKIYMANTDLSSLTTSNYVPYASFTQVYSGTFSCGSAGWYEITLDTPFDYNGAGQLAVMIDDNTNTYESSKSFKYHSATGKQIYKRQDDTDIDPASWTPASAIDYRPNTKFCIQEADMVQSTVTWVAGSNPSFGSQTDYEGTALSNPGTPSAASYCPGGKVFVGWTETPIVGEGSAPADLFTSVSGKSIPVGGTTYYAVFATSGSSSKTYQFDITPSQFNTTSYAANNNQKSNTATATDASGATMIVYWTSNQIMKNSSDMQWQKGNGYIYNSTDLGTVNSVTVTKSDGGYSTWYGTTEHPTDGSQGSGKGFFTVKENNTATGKATQVRVNFTKTITTYSNYATSCCTPLGSVTGNIGTNTPTSVTLTWSDVSGAEKYQVKVPGSSSHNDWTDAVSGVSVTKSCGTAYTAYFRAIDTNGSHCAEGPESTTAVPAVSWTVTSTGVTNATASPAIPSTTCSGFSTTISAATGYALPAEITVTNASKTWNSSTGALSISSVTGNVSITITPTCVPPVVTGDPADADYYVGDSPTPLSVTATLASGTRTYLWKVSTNGGSTWSDAAGTNNTASYSGASLSTASAGTLKFKCIVGNSEGGCTVESGVATITVANASYFPNGKTIFIQAESTSAWTGDGCVKAWFHTAGGSETAQSTYWLFDATGGDAGKKLFATVVPASGNLPYLDIQRFAANCSDWWNKNGGCSYSDANGSNTVRSTGKHDDSSDGDYVRWNASGVTLDLHGDPSGDDWASSLASFSDQGSGEWTATYNNYAPANAAGESQDFKVKTNYNGWIGNTGTNSNATLSGMHVGSTYNITATLNVISHSLTMSKTFVKGEVSFDLQGHGSAISKLTNVTAGSKISAPSPAPTATGYTFGGWFTDPECTDEWNFATDEVDETMTLYAKWTTNVYTITKTLTNVANAGLPASFTYTGATTTALNSTFTVDATNFFLPSSIAVTMGGTPLTAGTHYTYNNSTGAFTFTAVITGDIVITAAATAKLKSIAITTQPTTRKYFAGESFSSAGAVVTATMGDGSTKAVTASTTWTPPATPLAAGTGLTVTASYTENAINMTATTTIDVYSVTVNKVNEDGDAIDVAGVTATWTVGTKALAASATSASKYVFKEWQVTGASIGSTSSANTTLSSPTANVVVNAVFYKPRVVKWSVNGNDSYATGGPTTTVAYNGTISTVPTNPSGLACAGTFIAWTDAAHNNGTTAKASASYYGAALYTTAGDFPNITAATTTFYAVFAEQSNSDGYKYIGDDGTLTDGKKYIFVSSKSAGSAYALKATDLAAPNSGNNGTAVSVTVTSNAEGVLVTTINTALEFEYVSSGTKLKYEVDGPATRYLFINGDGVGMKSDDSRSRYTTDAGLQGWNNKVTTYYDVYYNSTSGKFEKMASAGSRVYAFIKQTATYGNYVTECDANIVSVTYDANGGVTSCANTTTDKTEDYTVCSTPPTRDYYTFAGWLCSADSKTYAASATIPAAAIDADFTLTAQWTPVPYSITYELYGGTNSGSNPATYNVTTATITLQDPTKGHDRFEGWYSTYSAGVYSDQVTSIPLGSHGNITLYAKWATRHEIIFDADGATTTIYRADDEDLSASVPGQSSVPSDPSAPTACSSKVFVGWSESTIDGETDTEPGDLMKPAAGTVDADKHYYAVWAIEESSSGTETIFTDDFNVTGTDEVTSRSGWTDLSTVYGGSGSIRFSSSKNAGSMTLDVSGMEMSGTWEIKFKIKKYGTDGSGALAVSSAFGDVTTSFSPTSVSTTDGANWTEKTITVTGVHSGTEIHFDGTANSRVYVKDVEIKRTGTITTHSAYSTSCCATKIVLSDPSITDASSSGSTITFDKSSPVFTCDGTKTVTATLTLTAGYQASALSFAVNSGTVSISPAISTPITSSQVYTLTFAEDQNATLTTTATIAAKPLNGITITPSSGEVYVGQYVDFTVSYDPADYLSPGYTLNATPVYVTKESATPANTKLRLKGGRGSGPGASITETVNETVTIKASGDNTKTASVNITVNPLPRVHFEDLVHGKEFADVVATLSENALNPNKTTKTSVDWVTPNANDCEENHLHLVGWIREDWPALVAYLNGTGDAPATTAIVGAGNDGSGNAYFIAAGASINVQTFDGVTFYAVWAEIK